jgi:uncharacterized membrane protein YeiH
MITFSLPLQELIEITATIAFALSGLIASARKNLDAFGVFVVTGVSSFGGGTLRDILLDRRPFFWVEHDYWLWVILFLSLLAILFMRNRHIPLTERAIQIPDALGLGLFTALGTQIAIEHQMPYVVCALMGVTTAVFGGVMRDIFCNEIPKAFNDHQPYAVLAFIGSLSVVSLTQIQVKEWIVLTISATLVSTLRIMTIYFKWKLPSWKIAD